MDAALWFQLKEWFGAAQHAGPEDRERIILQAEQESPELAHELRSLLLHLDTPWLITNQAFSAQGEEDDALYKESVGSYRLLREIGRGGTGIVFLAERADDEFHRPVALKLLRLATCDSRGDSLLTLERRALSQLQHANIAALLDWGATADRVPWLAMEYVDGEPIDQYAKARNLSLRERLHLFAQACGAVQYAHRRLVVHRDLKPANILVSRDGFVKLLDFGISELLEKDGPIQSVDRRFTPAYASPEQIQGGVVTVSTDVYGLGAVLYELISGHLPYREGPLADVFRRIVEEDPNPPSQAPGLAPEQRRAIRGDLDRIVLKAMARDPERRYGSVEQLLGDLERYLRGYPVTARRATLAHRAAKFARRNRLAVGACALALVGMMAGTGIALWHAAAARREQREAERRFTELQRLAHSVIFDLYDSLANVPGTVQARRLLVSTALGYLDQIRAARFSDHRVQMELAEGYCKLAEVQGKPFAANLGDSAGAVQNDRKALAILADQWNLHPDNHHAAALLFQAAGYTAENLPDPQPGADLLVGYVERADRWARTMPSVESAEAAGGVRNIRGLLLRMSGHLDQALQTLDEAAIILQRQLESSPNCLGCLLDLSVVSNFRADLFRDFNHLDDARAAYGASRSYITQAASISGANAQVRRQLAVIDRRESELLLDLGRLDEALSAARAGVALSVAVRDADAMDANALRDLAVANRRIGNVLCAKGESTEALDRLGKSAEYLRIRDQQNPSFDWSPYEYAQALNDYGACLLRSTQTGNAIGAFGKAVEAANRGLLQSSSNVQLYRERARAYAGLARATPRDGAAASERVREFFAQSAADWQELRQRSPLDRRDLHEQKAVAALSAAAAAADLNASNRPH